MSTTEATTTCWSCGEQIVDGRCEGCGRTTTRRPRVATPEETAELTGGAR